MTFLTRAVVLTQLLREHGALERPLLSYLLGELLHFWDHFCDLFELGHLVRVEQHVVPSFDGPNDLSQCELRWQNLFDLLLCFVAEHH